MDRDMTPAACWSCEAAVPARTIQVETVIRGRPAPEGGPYRLLRCPVCGVENGVLAGPRGGWLLHPLAGLAPPSLLDRILSAAERGRIERARSWWARNRERVDRFRLGAESEGPPPRPAPPPPPPPSPVPRPVAPDGPRSVLGVAADATATDVRRAFRRLAKRHHPDRNVGDEKAAERFREIRRAYEQVMRELGE